MFPHLIQTTLVSAKVSCVMLYNALIAEKLKLGYNPRWFTVHQGSSARLGGGGIAIGSCCKLCEVTAALCGEKLRRGRGDLGGEQTRRPERKK